MTFVCPVGDGVLTVPAGDATYGASDHVSQALAAQTDAVAR